MTAMRPDRPVGIVGYGAYVPRYRLKAAEISRIWELGDTHLPIESKSVPGPDEDTVTMSIEAGRNALARAEIDPAAIRALWVGSESHPYAVKPTSVIVAEALGVGPSTLAADWQFACKAGTEALQAAIALVGSGMGQHAMAIGMDTAQGRPGDALEYTAAAGGGALIVGPGDGAVATLEASLSYASDTPDFWRRPMQHYPQHAGRFTGQPAYFKHVLAAGRALMGDLELTAGEIDWAVFHQPNARFPQRAARELGFSREQIAPGLLSPVIGNTYAGATMVGLCAILDIAQPGQRILQVSFGSGAGSDAFLWRVGERIDAVRDAAPLTSDYVARTCYLDYGAYVRYRNELIMH